MELVKIHLLGPPRLEVEGAPIRLSRRKAVAALAYLLAARVPVGREALAVLLWPGTAATRALGQLRNILWVLRQSPLAPHLRLDGDPVEVRRGPALWVDLDRFRELLTTGRADRRYGPLPSPERLPLLAQAVELHRGAFLEGLRLPDGGPFEEWRVTQDETLRHELAETLELLARCHGARRRFDAAILYARRRLDLDPLDEPVVRHLMLLHARAGQRSAAVRLYKTTARRVRRELRVAMQDETYRLYKRIRAGEPREAPGRGPTLAHNLPAAPTPFVGRRDELARIHELLADPHCRLLTLTGLGGCGKTRLALEAAAEQVGGFDHGVHFVPLALAESTERLLPAILEALRVPLARRDPETGVVLARAEFPREGGVAPGDSAATERRLLEHLRERNALLVLDNFEHLLDGAGLVARVLASAPAVKVIATSRERLNLRGEWILEVAGLPYPRTPVETESFGAEGPGAFPAVQLFLQTARRARPDFAPQPADQAAIARICRAVEGIPLGLELAAAWVKALPCDEIEREIERGLDFLTTAERDVPERHRSLRAVFDQSWHLLSAEERDCFRGLAVFQGEFGCTAAREITGCTLGTLSQLVDKSLLRQTPSGRYEMLELLRQQAEARLAESPPDFEAAIDRHAAYYLGLLADSEPRLCGREQPASLQELSADAGNIRAAWLRAAQAGRFDLLHRAGIACWLMYEIPSRFTEGAEIFRETIDQLALVPGPKRDRDNPGLVRGFALTMYGWFRRYVDLPASRVALHRAYAELSLLPDSRELALTASLWSNLETASPTEEQHTRLRRALEFFERSGDDWGAAITCEALVWITALRELAEAEDAARRCLDLFRRAEDPWGIALGLFVVGTTDERRGRHDQARVRYEESLEIRRALGPDFDPDGIIMCLEALGRLCIRGGDYARARRHFLDDLDLCRRTGNRYRGAEVLAFLGLAAYALGDLTHARQHLDEALSSSEATENEGVASMATALLALTALAEDDAAQASRLLDARRERADSSIWPAPARARLAFLRHDLTEAEQQYRRALAYAARWRDAAIGSEGLCGLLETLSARQRGSGGEASRTDFRPRAARVLGHLLGNRALSGPARTRAEALLEQFRAESPESFQHSGAGGDDDFARSFEDGRGLGFDEAVALLSPLGEAT